MSWFYADLIIQNVPLDITTQQIYKSMNDQLDNGILTITEEINADGEQKNFKIYATCRSHNPLFNKMDDKLTIYMNDKKNILKFNVVIH